MSDAAPRIARADPDCGFAFGCEYDARTSDRSSIPVRQYRRTSSAIGWATEHETIGRRDAVATWQYCQSNAALKDLIGAMPGSGSGHLSTIGPCPVALPTMLTHRIFAARKAWADARSPDVLGSRASGNSATRGPARLTACRVIHGTAIIRSRSRILFGMK